VNNDEPNELILDEVSVEAQGGFTVNGLLTNGKKSTSHSVLYVSVDDNEITLSKVSIKRHVGELKFSEGFDYEGLLDESKWDYEVGGNGWGNGELQYYTGKNPDNAKVENGALIITAQEEKFQNNDYTSSRVRTKDGFTYGRFEITAKLPSGRGTWPAIWMLPEGNNYGGWPNSGEIDIMEHVGFDMDVVHANLHMSEFNFRKNNNPTGMMTIPNVDTEYHTFTMEWTPYQIDMYIDGYHYLYFKNDGQGPKHWPYDESFYMLINIAIGGAWGAQQGIDPIFPQQLVIDSIKIYDLEDEVKDSEGPEAIKSTDIVVQGTAVELSFDPVQDNYKVDYYEAVFNDGENEITHILPTTKGLILNLQEETAYELSIVAIDESGNESEPYLAEVKTGRVKYGEINTWLTPKDIYFVNGASIIEEDGTQVIAGFESGHLLGYGFNVPSDGEYILEIEISGKLFDGEVKLVDEAGTVLTTFIATKTGAKDSYSIIATEAFELMGGKQVILLETIKNGYQIRNMRMVPSI
jgi:beta-glucanase (GH16 family)